MMTDFPWLAKYPEGVPAQIDPDRIANIPALLDQVAQKHPSAPIFTNMGVTLTASETQAMTKDFAAYLQSLPGMKKGDRVAIMMPNLLQYPIAMFAILRAGFIIVNVNPLYTARELEHQLKDSGAKAIIIIENFAKTLERVIDRTEVKHVITTQVGDLFPCVKRLLVNTVVKHVKKIWSPNGTCPALLTTVRLCLAVTKSVSNPLKSATKTWLFCNTRAAPRVWPRAPCSRTAMCWLTLNKLELGLA